LKILHTADIHLKSLCDERWAALEKIIEVGKREHIDVLAISGDLFDAENDTENLRPKIREVFSNNGFKIVLIAGNHDCTVCQGMYFGSDATILTDSAQPFELDNARIWGLPFEETTTERIIEKIAFLKSRLDKEYTNILLHHGELLDAFFSRKDFGEEGEQRYMPLKLSYFKDMDLDYVLSGHFHSHFNVWTFDDRRFFVYPGSPISITRKETGQRKLNLFEVGKNPTPYPLDTPHFEDLAITLDPFEEKHPIQLVKEELTKVNPPASVILTINGYINGKKIGMTEASFVKAVEEATKGKCELHFEFKDVESILENDLFKSYLEKLNQKDFPDEKKNQLRDLAIRAMMEAKA
jgi:exonuclease SbcD